MPLEKKKIVAKFSQIPQLMTLERYQNCLHGGYERMSVNLRESSSEDNLQSVTISFPSLEDQHGKNYKNIIGVFWVSVLPPKTLPADYTGKAFEMFKKEGRYDEVFEDVRVSLSKTGDDFFLKAEAAKN